MYDDCGNTGDGPDAAADVAAGLAEPPAAPTHAAAPAPARSGPGARYLNVERLASIAPEEFQAAEPFPWVNPGGLIHDSAFETLRRSLPDLERFTRRFNIRRRHGQRPHDRFTLEYHSKSPVARVWHEFIAELESPLYREWIAERFGERRFFMTYHWHYATRGCEVSPHCDGPRKLGSHIFYFNGWEDWHPDWGGHTLILDDGGRIDSRSAPDFDDFPRVVRSSIMDNHSLLFRRRGNAWHGVRPLSCPEDRVRKVFIVVINRLTPTAFAKRLASRWWAG